MNMNRSRGLFYFWVFFVTEMKVLSIYLLECQRLLREICDSLFTLPLSSWSSQNPRVAEWVKSTPWHETNTKVIRMDIFPVFARVQIRAWHVFAPRWIPQESSQIFGAQFLKNNYLGGPNGLLPFKFGPSEQSCHGKFRKIGNSWAGIFLWFVPDVAASRKFRSPHVLQRKSLSHFPFLWFVPKLSRHRNDFWGSIFWFSDFLIFWFLKRVQRKGPKRGVRAPQIMTRIHASADTGPACTRATVSSLRIISYMYWFCSGGG